MGVDEAVAQRVSVEVKDLEDVAILRGALDPVDLIVIDPLSAGFQAPACAFLQINHGRGYQVLVLCRKLQFFQPLCCCHVFSSSRIRPTTSAAVAPVLLSASRLRTLMLMSL